MQLSGNGSPTIIRMRRLVELPATEAQLRESLPAAVGHFSARNRCKRASKILRFKSPASQEKPKVS